MPVERTDPDLLAVSRGDRCADVLLRGGRIVNVFTRQLQDANIALFGGRIAGVGRYDDAESVIDLDGAIVAPGFIDAHMHVESTMMTPEQFVRVAAPHGTTGVVFDPHEIANVLGAAGLRWLMAASEDLAMNIRFAVSSCVPASPLETSGARLDAEDLEPFFDDERVVALAEMMNYPGVVNADSEVLRKIRIGLAHHVVDGHAPLLTGKPLQTYLAAGVSSDHECSTREEAEEKLCGGMMVFIREGSAARNLDALLPLVTPANAHRFCFCTDDRHPDDLVNEGHIDHVVRKAIAAGLDACTAISMASLHAAMHYGLHDLGAIAPGRFADLVVCDDLADIQIRRVFHHGSEIATDGQFTGASGVARSQVAPPHAPIKLPGNLSADSFAIPASPRRSLIRVIGICPGQIVTDDLRLEPRVVGSAYEVDPERDLLKLAVIERHAGAGNIGLAFVQGFGFRGGALASTVGHDSHNLIVVGDSDTDMLVAAENLRDAGGGHCVVRNGEALATLPLPIAGLMSDRTAEDVVAGQRLLLDAARELGCAIADPFMPLSFLPLCVIPSLKLSDMGLVDVNRFAIVPLEVDDA